MRAQELALGALAHERHRQALSLAYFDVFATLVAIALALLLVVTWMRRSVVQKGVAVAAE